MPAYNFQRRFVEKILSGEKPHTIRRRRRYPTKIGDMLYMYTGLRTKQAFKFAEAPCIDVMPIDILPLEKRIIRTMSPTVSEWLSTHEIRRLACRDGFGSEYDAVDEFFYFFLTTYHDLYLEDFEIIWWNVNQLKAMEVRDEVR